MNKLILTGVTALIPVILLSGFALAQSAQVEALRGAEVDEPVPLDQVHRTIEGRMQRNYRQQPPLIPHSIEQYQIDLRTNQCLSCHDWTKAGERNAPTLSMTHYLDREGRELDQIAGTRYFCNQCHVPQADTPALVDNVFEPSSGN
ncbi:nitrate reductase cytochrome c-type subunit [Ruegeria lacuscaerulensis]|uniref:nitrate reductase cytochrome c-type subunit n=1 Tax=Ruegeria lacuscaerulensis TaxID=55218 RepID=UPI001479FE1D|nr:nitrate reductase cytochrome c-type subunit [Ruegeria lacuscaerulensis]